MYWKWGEVSRG